MEPVSAPLREGSGCGSKRSGSCLYYTLSTVWSLSTKILCKENNTSQVFLCALQKWKLHHFPLLPAPLLETKCLKAHCEEWCDFMTKLWVSSTFLAKPPVSLVSSPSFDTFSLIALFFRGGFRNSFTWSQNLGFLQESASRGLNGGHIYFLDEDGYGYVWRWLWYWFY